MLDALPLARRRHRRRRRPQRRPLARRRRRLRLVPGVGVEAPRVVEPGRTAAAAAPLPPGGVHCVYLTRRGRNLFFRGRAKIKKGVAK